MDTNGNKQRFRLGKRKKLFPHEDSQAVAQVVQRGCAVSMLIFKDPRFSRPNWVKPWATWSYLTADPAVRRAWTRGLLNSLPAWIILLLCDSSWLPSGRCSTKDGSRTGCVPVSQGIPVRDNSSSSFLTFCYKEGCGIPSNLTQLFIVCDSPGVRDINALISTALLCLCYGL